MGNKGKTMPMIFARIAPSAPAFAPLLVALLVTDPAFGEARDFPRLADLMTAEELETTGVTKLSDAERQALEAWLVRYTARDAERIKKSSKRVKKAEAKEIKARLVGAFNGWQGGTVFRLDNGEIWRQIGNEVYYPRKKDIDAAVEIHRGLISGYQLELVATGARVKVKRIR